MQFLQWVVSTDLEVRAFNFHFIFGSMFVFCLLKELGPTHSYHCWTRVSFSKSELELLMKFWTEQAYALLKGYCCTGKHNSHSIVNSVSGNERIWESKERSGERDCDHKLLQSAKPTCSYSASCPWGLQHLGCWCHVTILGELRRLVCVILLGEFKTCIMLHFRVSLKSSVSLHFCTSASLAAGILHLSVSYYII